MDMHANPISVSETMENNANSQAITPAKKKRQNRKKKGTKKTLGSQAQTSDADFNGIDNDLTLNTFEEEGVGNTISPSTSAPEFFSHNSSATTLSTGVKIDSHIQLRSILRSVSVEPCTKEQGSFPEIDDTGDRKEELYNEKGETTFTQIEEEALFATTNIPPGRRIISEPPLIALPATSRSIDDIYSAFLSLPLTQQSAFMGLKPAATLQYRSLTTLIDQLIEHYLPMHSKFELGENMTEREHYIYKELGERIQILTKMWRVAARFQAYCHSLTNKPVAEREHLPIHIPVTGVFLTISRLPHSCMPNCYAAYNPATGRMNIHTVRPIVPGQCLTISIIANHIWYQGIESRTAMLAENYKYSCSCPACDPRHPEYENYECLRSRLHLNTLFIQTFLTTVDAQENPAPYKAVLQSLDGCQSPLLTNNAFDDDEFRDAERKLIENISILQDLGCQDTELSRWRNALKDVIYPYFNQPSKAVAQAKIAFEEGVKCWGRDHPDIGPLESGLRAAEKAMENKQNAKEREQAEIRRKLFEKGKLPWKRRPR